MGLNNYIGNYESTKALNDWLVSFFDFSIPYVDDKGDPKELKSYVILHGSSGNGKTFLVECLAKEYNLYLLRFTSDDFGNINDIEKSINLQPIQSERKKLVVFDDIRYIKNKRRLYKLYETSNFPVVYIVDNLSKIDRDFIDESLVLQIKKPMNFEIRKILEQRVTELNIECKNLYDISEKCKSVRTALQSMLLDCIIEKAPSSDSNYTSVKLMSKRVLREDISWFALLDAFKNIKPINNESLAVMQELSYFDFVVHYLHFKDKRKLLNKIFFNILPNIELIAFDKDNYKKREFKKKKEKKKEEQVVKEVEEVKQPGLGTFW